MRAYRRRAFDPRIVALQDRIVDPGPMTVRTGCRRITLNESVAWQDLQTQVLEGPCARHQELVPVEHCGYVTKQ
jgi:hypothetical protein